MGQIVSSRDVIIPGLNKSLYEIILDHSSDPIFCFDKAGTYLYINLAFSKAFHLMPSDIVGKRIWDVFPGAAGDMRFAAVKKAYETKKEVTLDVKVPTTEGDIYFLTTVTPIMDPENEPQIAICISKEITARKQIELELQREKMAVEDKNRALDQAVIELYQKTITDGLTGLYTRQYSIDKLTSDAEIFISKEIPISLGFMDLDFFKKINDTYGHLVGDQVLREFSADLMDAFSPYGYVGRYGGEEFIVVMNNMTKEQGLPILEQFLQKVRSKSYSDMKVNITASVGFSQYHSGRVDDFLKVADQLLYLAKANGRNRIEVDFTSK